MSTAIEPRVDLDALPEGDPFYYGSRYVEKHKPDGSTHWVQVPLTLRDFLHPQEGDHFVESDLQLLVREYLHCVFRWLLKGDPEARVFSDLPIYWDHAEYDHHSPDTSVFLGVKDRGQRFTSFDVSKEGVRPRLIIEVVSPRTRSVDITEKFEMYHSLQIPFYIILDRVHEEDAWELKGYRYSPAQYVRMPNDEQGRLWLETVGVWLGTDEQRVICYDAVTMQEILTDEDVRDEAAVAKKRAEEERTRREQAETRMRELEAELAKLRGQSSNGSRG